jgi:enoyl-CoA hydratase/carnithine racemase
LDLKYLTYELKGDVAVLGLNRPEKRNAISDAFVEELAMLVRKAENEAKAGVIHGHGTHFCAGLDCQSALKFDPLSASNIDPLGGEQARRCVALT